MQLDRSPQLPEGAQRPSAPARPQRGSAAAGTDFEAHLHRGEQSRRRPGEEPASPDESGLTAARPPQEPEEAPRRAGDEGRKPGPAPGPTPAQERAPEPAPIPSPLPAPALPEQVLEAGVLGEAQPALATAVPLPAPLSATPQRSSTGAAIADALPASTGSDARAVSGTAPTSANPVGSPFPPSGVPAAPESANPGEADPGPLLREQGPLTSPLRDAAATARAEAQTPPPLPDPGPQERLAADVLRQVQVALDPARRSMLVRLNPRELGSISIRLELGAGRVRAVLRAENPRALELLERHLPELRAALAAQGLETEDIDLGLAEQGPRRQHEESRAQEGSAGRKPATDALVHETTVALDLRSISAGLGLDTYA